MKPIEDWIPEKTIGSSELYVQSLLGLFVVFESVQREAHVRVVKRMTWAVFEDFPMRFYADVEGILYL